LLAGATLKAIVAAIVLSDGPNSKDFTVLLKNYHGSYIYYYTVIRFCIL